MTEAKFTKGPWNWEHDTDTSSVIQVFSESDESKGDPDICRVQHEPNAHLIAAAPEMYEMIKVMLEQFGNEEDCINEYDYIVIREAKKLLAKARGES